MPTAFIKFPPGVTEFRSADNVALYCDPILGVAVVDTTKFDLAAMYRAGCVPADVAAGPLASRPASAHVGARYVTTDTNQIFLMHYQRGWIETATLT